MDYLHRHGVKGYITLNTLVFSGELEELERAARTAIAAGVDAALVQDLGAARLLAELCPDWPLHASTQMSLASGEAIHAARVAGDFAGRAGPGTVPGRNPADSPRNALGHRGLRPRRVVPCGLRAVHGELRPRRTERQPRPLCPALPPPVPVDPRRPPGGPWPAAISPQPARPGRLRPAAGDSGGGRGCVEDRGAAEVGRVRGRRDAALPHGARCGDCRQACPIRAGGDRRVGGRLFPRLLATAGWTAAIPGAESPAKARPTAAFVSAASARSAVAASPSSWPRRVREATAWSFEARRAINPRRAAASGESFATADASTSPQTQELSRFSFGRRGIDLGEVLPGEEVWKTDDPRLTRRLRKTFAGGRPRRRAPLDLIVEAAPGRPLRVTARADSGAECSLQSSQNLQEAVRHPLTVEVLAEQFGRLGGTAYALRRVDARIEGRPMAPLSVLGQLRCELIGRLDVLGDPAAAASRGCGVAAGGHASGNQGTVPNVARGKWDGAPFRLAAPAVDRPLSPVAQVRPAVLAGAAEIIVDLPDAEQSAEAIFQGRAGGAAVLLAAPRMQKPGEMAAVESLLRLGADGLLARNLAAAAPAPSGVRAVCRRFLSARRERTERGLAAAAGRPLRDSRLRLFAGTDFCPLHRGFRPMLGSRRPPTHADVSHAALRLFARRFRPVASGATAAGRAAAATRGCKIGWASCIRCGPTHCAESPCSTAACGVRWNLCRGCSPWACGVSGSSCWTKAPARSPGSCRNCRLGRTRRALPNSAGERPLPHHSSEMAAVVSPAPTEQRSSLSPG